MSASHANTPQMSLLEIQRAMAAAVMMPLTADEDMQSVAPDGNDMHAVADAFIAPNNRLNRIRASRTLQPPVLVPPARCAWPMTFPRCVRSLAASRFESLSIAYLKDHPSRSFSLRNLGSSLVQWMAEHPELSGRRHRLALDIARLEWAFVEAFDNAELKPLTMEQIRSLSGDSKLALQPHVRLLALDHPAVDLVLALHQRQKRDSSEAGVRHDDSNDATAAPLPRVSPSPYLGCGASHRQLGLLSQSAARGVSHTVGNSKRPALGRSIGSGFRRLPQVFFAVAADGQAVVCQLGRIWLDLREVLKH